MILRILENDFWQVGILAQTGASIAFGRIKRSGRWTDFMRPTDSANYENASLCSSYVLVPWSNRIRDGKFRFQGTEYQLRAEAKDGTAIHGVGKDLAWKVEYVDEQRLRATFNSSDHPNVNYPFKFSAAQEFRLDGKKFSVYTSVKNEDTRTMPAGFGHHPYFQRVIGGDAVSVELPCSEYYVLEDAMPDGAPVPLSEERLDFRKLKPLQPEAHEKGVDDLFAGREGEKPVRIVYGDTEVQMHADELYKHIILYAPKEKSFWAVEPVTNANDGFNLHDKGVIESNVIVLQPNEESSATFTLEIIRN
jgi:aldose 1-epimerase